LFAFIRSILNHSIFIFVQVRGRVAPEPVAEVPGSGSETYIKSLFNVFESRSDFADVNADPGQPFLDVGSAWRTHSTFHPVTGMRRSADTILDRNNANLDIRKKTKVASILFDGDLGVPLTAGYTAGDTPRARCVRFTSLEVVCVKAEGRIYISSGALHTPELLLKSGIGPSGKKVTNTEVRSTVFDVLIPRLDSSFAIERRRLLTIFVC
jgi:GMC oxidoreductase